MDEWTKADGVEGRDERRWKVKSKFRILIESIKCFDLIMNNQPNFIAFWLWLRILEGFIKFLRVNLSTIFVRFILVDF